MIEISNKIITRLPRLRVHDHPVEEMVWERRVSVLSFSINSDTLRDIFITIPLDIFDTV